MDVLRIIMFYFPNLEWNKDVATVRGVFWKHSRLDDDAAVERHLSGTMAILGPKSYWESSSIE